MLSVSGTFLLDGIKGFLYLDPGSGSVLLQVLIALFLGIGIAVRTQWSKIKTALSARKKSGIPPEHEE